MPSYEHYCTADLTRKKVKDFNDFLLSLNCPSNQNSRFIFNLFKQLLRVSKWAETIHFTTKVYHHNHELVERYNLWVPQPCEWNIFELKDLKTPDYSSDR